MVTLGSRNSRQMRDAMPTCRKHIGESCWKYSICSINRYWISTVLQTGGGRLCSALSKGSINSLGPHSFLSWRIWQPGPESLSMLPRGFKALATGWVRLTRKFCDPASCLSHTVLICGPARGEACRTGPEGSWTSNLPLTSEESKVCLVTRSCLTLCDPMDCSPPGFSVHGILQARILKWVTTPSPRGSNPGLLHLQEDSLPSEPAGKPKEDKVQSIKGMFPKCPWELLMALGCQCRAPGIFVLCSLWSLEPCVCVCPLSLPHYKPGLACMYRDENWLLGPCRLSPPTHSVTLGESFNPGGLIAIISPLVFWGFHKTMAWESLTGNWPHSTHLVNVGCVFGLPLASLNSCKTSLKFPKSPIHLSFPPNNNSLDVCGDAGPSVKRFQTLFRRLSSAERLRDCWPALNSSRSKTLLIAFWWTAMNLSRNQPEGRWWRAWSEAGRCAAGEGGWRHPS